MKNSAMRWLARLGLILAMAQSALGYVYLSSQSSWLPGYIPMKVKVGITPVLSDGSHYSSSAQAGMQIWNGQLGAVQFYPQTVPAGGQVDYENDIYFDSTIEGDAFGEGVLAVTLIYTTPSIRQIFEADIIFNNAYTWDSYPGPLREAEDFRRVVTHELGHVLGLSHPDEQGQSVEALMNSQVSNLDHLTADDIAGAQSFYLAPGQNYPPANNNFANATTITLGNGSLQVNGMSFYATKETGEPDHDPGEGTGGASVWWKWTAPANGGMTITTQYSHFDTLLGVYTGSALNELSPVGINDDVDPSVIRYSSVAFTATSGTTYHIAVDGWDGESGLVVLNLNFNALNPPSISTHPNSTAVFDGSYASFFCAASGSQPLAYRWQRLPAGGGSWTDLQDGAAYSGTGTQNLNVQGAVLAMNGDQFRMVATNSAGSATSGAATLTVNARPPSVQITPGYQVIAKGANVSLTAQVTGSIPIALQWSKDGVVIPGAVTATLALTNFQSSLAGTYSLAAQNAAGSSNASVTLVLEPVPQITLQPVGRTIAPGSTVTFSVTATSQVSPLAYQWSHNSVPIAGATAASYTITNAPLTAAGEYSVAVSNPSGTVVSIGVTLSFTGPQYSSRPLSRIVLEGQPVTIDAAAAGSGAVSYVWKRNRKVITGATGPTLLIPSASRVDNGVYEVFATDSIGTTRSVFYLSVTPVNGMVQVVVNDDYSWDSFLPPADLGPVIGVAAGSSVLNMAIRADGTVRVWDVPSGVDATPPAGLAGVVAVDTDFYYCLALKADGTVAAWGNSGYGLTTVPAGLDQVVAIAAGNLMAIALKADGTIVCWGDGAGVYPAPALENVIAIAAEQSLGVALTADGTSYSWGLGPDASLIPTGLTAIATGLEHGVGIREDDSLVAWGANSGLLPTGVVEPIAIKTTDDHASVQNLVLSTDGLVHIWGTNLDGLPATIANVYAISSGLYHSLALASPGPPVIHQQPISRTSLLNQYVSFQARASGPGVISYRWQHRPAGATTWSDLSDGSEFIYTGTPILGIQGASAELQLSSFRCVISNAVGTVYSDPALLTFTVNPPTISLHPQDAVSFNGAPVRFTVMVSHAAPYTLQWRRNGQPVDGASAAELVVSGPDLVEGDVYDVVVADNFGHQVVTDAAALTLRRLVTVVDTAIAGAAAYFITADGELWASGDNSWGQYGDGSQISRSSFKRVATGVLRSYAGIHHLLQLRTDGSLWATGGNEYGQLGDGTTQLRKLPLKLADDVVSASAAGASTYFIKSDGSLWAVGHNYYGTLGDGTTTSRFTPVKVADDVWRVCAAEGYAMFLKLDRSLWVMGNNDYGQLGDGTRGINRPTPLKIANGVKSMAGTSSAALFLGVDGILRGMGLKDSGPLAGLPTAGSYIQSPQELAELNVARIVAGSSHFLIQKTDGSIYGTGRNEVGQLANGTTANTSELVPVAGSYFAYFTAHSSSLFINPEGHLYAAGNNDIGQLGLGIKGGYYPTPVMVAGVVPLAPAAAAGLSVTPSEAIAGIVLRWSHTLGASYYTIWRSQTNALAEAVVIARDVLDPVFADFSGAPGETYYYWVQAVNAAGSSTPVGGIAGVQPLVSPPVFTRQPVDRTLLAGSVANFTVNATGLPVPSYQWQVKRVGDQAWNNTGDGARYTGSGTAILTISDVQSYDDLDQYRCVATNLVGTTTSDAALLTVRPAPAPASLAAGYAHTPYTRVDGSLWAMGAGSLGQLGDGAAVDRSVPVPVTTGVAAVAAGAYHTLYLKADATLWAAGQNSHGALGTGDLADRVNPQPVATSVAGLAAGVYHSLFLKRDGTLWGMGWNSNGQLGNGSVAEQVASPVQADQDVATAAAGFVHSLWVKQDGTAWAAGFGGNGQFGHGSAAISAAPVQVGTGMAAVAAGHYHSLFLGRDGRLWASGGNANGQLGDGTTTDRLAMVPVDSDVVQITAAVSHSLYLKADGTLWGMGDNANGQLGTGGTANQLTPVQIATNVARVATGFFHTLFLKRDGTLWGMGSNGYGQLGIGVTANQLTPIEIVRGGFATLPQPGSVTATESGTLAHVRLTWMPVPGASQYEVWRGATADPGAAVKLAGHLTSTLFADYTGSSGTTYYYRARAVQPDGQWTASDPVTGRYGAVALAQTITFAGPSNQGYAATPIALSATASSGLTVSFSLLSGPATLSGNQLTLTGIGAVTVRASQPGDASYEAAPNVDRTFTVTTNFDSWELGYFTAPELADANVSGPNADPDGDGMANLVEYALGLEPRAFSTAGLPEVTTDATHWIYTYTRPEGRTDVTCTVECSTDLSGWGAPTVAEVLASASGGVETWQAKQPLTSANVFFRLKVGQ